MQLFRFRVPEELYDLEHDPDCLDNLIDSPQHAKVLASLRQDLQDWMERTGDPMLPAFLDRDSRSAVDQVLRKTYGPLPGKRRR